MVAGSVTIWCEPIPLSPYLALWWQWERPGIQVVTMPGLVMPPSEAKLFMANLLQIPSAVGDQSRVTIYLVE